ncbi:MAG: WYL domain-containing protein [Oscillospiraceae bacterium]|nr:WYL domain-containing protein [Oscillospiraceae bacterium]
MSPILFHEIYGSYFNVAAKVLKEACNNTLTDKRLYEIISENGFGESALGIPTALKGGEWSLLTPDLRTPVKRPPAMPLTLLQKRWMKALLSDPHIKLFGISCEGLDGVEPLYTQDAFYYFDRYNDGDPFEDKDYISRFRRILTAIKEKRLVDISYNRKYGEQSERVYFPWYLEYSSKDDKFRLIATAEHKTWIINLGRITSVVVLDCAKTKPSPPKLQTYSLVIELTDERNALERAMLHFSHLEKETVRLSKNRYQITLRYDRGDETELLIRVLSFGPMIRVTSPDRFISLIRERLIKQQHCDCLNARPGM